MRQLEDPKNPQRVVASRSTPKTLNELLPAGENVQTPMPVGLRDRRQQAVAVALQAMRSLVRRGATLIAALDAHCGVTVLRWDARMALDHHTERGYLTPGGLPAWDEHRTTAERLAVIDRTLMWLGVPVRPRRHGGGWRVSSGGAR